MRIIDEIMPKIKTEARLDKDNQTLWIKADTLDGYGRVIIEDGSIWCRIFYEGCGECTHNKSEQTIDSYSYTRGFTDGRESMRKLFEQTENSSDIPNNCKDCIRSVRNYNKAFEDEPQSERSE